MEQEIRKLEMPTESWSELISAPGGKLELKNAFIMQFFVIYEEREAQLMIIQRQKWK